MKWMDILQLFKRKAVETYTGCTLCYESGVVRITTGNRHFRGQDIVRLCPRGCKLTEYGTHRLNS